MSATVKMSMSEHQALMIAGHVISRSLTDVAKNYLLDNTEIVTKGEAAEL